VVLLLRLGSLGSGPRETVYAAGDITYRIVILPITGPIFDVTDQWVHDALRQLESDPPRALILRIDSPGGGVAASDRIAEQLGRFQRSAGIPVIASYGGEAASGAYYISAACDRIIAEPTCITGSIGVIMPAFTIEQLLEKIGVTPRTLIADGADRKDVGSITRAWTDEDRGTLQVIIDQMHARFVQVVADGRGLTTEQVAAAADGAPLTAQQAVALQLIDEIGYLSTAIDRAAEAADLPDDVTPHVTLMTARTGLGSMLPLGARSGGRLLGFDEQWQRGLGEALAGRLPLFMRSTFQTNAAWGLLLRLRSPIRMAAYDERHAAAVLAIGQRLRGLLQLERVRTCANGFSKTRAWPQRLPWSFWSSHWRWFFFGVVKAPVAKAAITTT
jgi:protease-4